MHVFKTCFVVACIISWAIWIVALASQIQVTTTVGRPSVGVLWFAIVVQLFVNIGTVFTLLSRHRAVKFRATIAAFAVIAVSLGGIGINDALFSTLQMLRIVGASWLVIVIVDFIWIVYFTADVWSLPEKVPPVDYDEAQVPAFATEDPLPAVPINEQEPSLRGYPATVVEDTAIQSLGHRPKSEMTETDFSMSRLTQPISAHSMISSVVEETESGVSSDVSYTRIAKALYEYSAATPAPRSSTSRKIQVEELSFKKGDILDVRPLNKKWWPARNKDGREGIAPSNFLELLPDSKLKNNIQ